LNLQTEQRTVGGWDFLQLRSPRWPRIAANPTKIRIGSSVKLNVDLVERECGRLGWDVAVLFKREWRAPVVVSFSTARGHRSRRWRHRDVVTYTKWRHCLARVWPICNATKHLQTM